MLPQENNRKVFAIIVHHGPSRQTINLVHQLASGESVPENIVVVDHGAQQLQLQCGGSVSVVRPARNRGYGAGINVGLSVLASEGVQLDDIVVCMNNDIVVNSGTIRRVKRWWQDHPEPSLVGAKAGAVNLLTGRAKIMGKKKGKRRIGKVDEEDDCFSMFHVPCSIFFRLYIHGAFFAAPFRVFMSTHGYPDHFFLYWEDVLFSQRVRKRGIPLHVIPKLGTSHSDGLEHQPAEQLYYLVRNGAMYLERYTLGVFRVYWWVCNRLRYLYHRLISRNNIVVVALADALRGKFGKARV